MKGRSFASLAEEHRHLLEGETQVADPRRHGSTQKQVKKCLEEVERSALRPWPADRSPGFEEGRRRVHRDGHVEVARAYDSVPPEYLGREVWVGWDSHVVRIYSSRFEPICIHARHGPGRFRTHARHVHDQKRSGMERGTAYHLNQASLSPSRVAVATRGPVGRTEGSAPRPRRRTRADGAAQPGQPASGPVESPWHPVTAIAQACATACSHGAYRLRTLRERLKRQGDRQEQFEFPGEHPIIRSMAEYGPLVHTAFEE